METLFTYLEALGSLENISFDLSLARGLDYYTGLIYEAVLLDPTIGLGSIAGGGRYDGLIGMFSGKPIPAVGGSIGIERIFNILEAKYKNNTAIRANQTMVYVCTIGSNVTIQKLKLTRILREAGINTEYSLMEKVKPQK